MKEVVQTILANYNICEVNLLHNKAVDLLSLLDDQQLEQLIDSNKEFANLIQLDLGKEELQQMIDILIEYI